jgi:hypothetical protein
MAPTAADGPRNVESRTRALGEVTGMPDNGDVDMDTEMTAVFMRVSDEIGQKLEAWKQVKAEITNYESGIGVGRLGQQFRPDYVGARDSVSAVADRIPGGMRAMAKAGANSVEEYRQADAAAAAQFPR